ncbi:NADH-ubiquinone oxidoreductase chain C [invertebrate metagenome]|uniref:NADH-ubiquinone oxidoreductase chain C n=1 Tax=invertebrate metagenome TaxID=1711999 RepID=A0A484H4H8_9ZZZZ
MLQILQDLGDYVGAAFVQEVEAIAIVNDELTLTVQRLALIKILTFLRDDSNCQFRQLMFVTGADYPERERRFEVVYHLLSLCHNQRIRVKVEASEEKLVPSVTSLFSSANWFEREVWDMYGVAFTDHPDLRRLLTDYGFEGHPLRKDFPLTGYSEIRYDDEHKRVVYEPVQLTQEFRTFDFLSPWEGYDEPRTPPDNQQAEGKS